MMKNLLLTVTILLCSTVHAIQPEKVETLSGKVVLSSGTSGYYVFSDNSCWRVISFCKRWRSLIEWWNGVQLVPETFECTPNDWDLDTPIEVYPKLGFPGIPEENASNKEALDKCTHVFINSRSGQILFGCALGTAQCVVQVYQDGYHEGDIHGYNNGYHAGKIRGYNNGWNAGRQEGIQEERLRCLQNGCVKGNKKTALRETSSQTR